MFTDIWFLWTLFWISILVAIALKLSKDRAVRLIPLLICVGIVLYFIPNNEGNLFMYPFFLTGLFYSSFEDKLTFFKSKKKLICISSTLLFTILLYGFTSRRLMSVGGLYISGRGDILNDLYRYFTGGVGTVAFILICGFIYDCIKEDCKVIEQIVRLAKYSGELYCVQCIVVAYIGRALIKYISAVIGYNPLTYNSFIFETMSAPIAAGVFICIFLYCMERVKIHKRLYRFLFGW